MDFAKEKGKKGLIFSTWERCKSIGRGRKTRSSTNTPSKTLKTKSKSWPRIDVGGKAEDDRKSLRKCRVAPEGCFSVYVGPEKQRFVIKAEYANHPLFQMLLEEAESEYGYNSQGPLYLPCNVDIFYKVLMDMDYGDRDYYNHQHRCGYPYKRYVSYKYLSPSPMVAINQF